MDQDASPSEPAHRSVDRAELLNSFLDSSPDWLFAKDLEHRFLFVNQSFAAALGLTPAQVIGRRDTEFWGEDPCEGNAETGHRGFHNDDRRAFRGETVHNPRDEAQVADGSTRIFDSVKSPLRDRSGTIIGVLCYCRDVTERHRAEEALRQSEERFRTLVGNIPGAVYRSDAWPPTRHLFLSEGVLAVTGFEAEELLTEEGTTYSELVLPEDVSRTAATVHSAIARAEAYHVRYRIRHRDGSIRWVSEQGRATRSADGAPQFLDGVYLDVTARVAAEEGLREREERLRAIVDHEPECVKVLDRAGCVLEMNPAGLRMLGAKSIEEVRGAAARSMVRAKDQAAFDEMVQAVFCGETRILVFEVEALDGTQLVLETHSVPMWDAEHGTVRALLGVTRDITERRRAEAAQKALEAQLRQSQKMEAMGTLAGGIAHDFNNILTSIIGHGELMLSDLTPDVGAREDVDAILAAAARARDLVQQILTFSRNHEEERHILSLRPIVNDALQLIRASLPTTVEIRAEIADRTHPVAGSASQLQQVLVNLCTNAGHAMRDQGGTLTVRLENVDVGDTVGAAHANGRPGPHVRIGVEDTGHGMTPDQLERIFEPFYTTKSPSEGTGLGLAVVHGIVQSHGGRVTVESRPGRGATFHVHLPASHEVSAAAAEPAEVVPRGSGQHVLFVDDEGALVGLAHKMMGRLGYRVAGYERPEDALVHLRRDPDGFDLVVCDLTMPVMDGLEFAALVREVRPDLPVVLTSGFGGAVGAERLHEVGVRELLDKPFVLRDLAEALHRNLEPGRAS